MLKRVPISLSDRAIPQKVTAFIDEGRARFKDVYCFDFVPSDYETVWRVLDSLPRVRFCEWGSGFGVVTGLAELLGYEACGIEMDENLADASRKLLAEFGLSSRITCGDYMAARCEAELYFVYCWPGKVTETEEYFEHIALPGNRLLICYGQSDIHCFEREIESNA